MMIGFRRQRYSVFGQSVDILPMPRLLATFTVGAGGGRLAKVAAPESVLLGAILRVPLQAVLSSDNVTPATGKTILIKISKNGGPFRNPFVGATTATEIGSGSYYVDLVAQDTSVYGPLIVLGTAATIDNCSAVYDVSNAAKVAL